MDEPTNESAIETKVSTLLKDRSETVTVVETCTGGMLSMLLTSVPGASEYFNEGLIPYSYDAHRTRLGVPREILDEHGAASATTTRVLAERARDLTDSDWGLAVSGIAGPSGGSAEKPVGTAFVGVAYAAEWETNESYSESTRNKFSGDRPQIREQIARYALECLADHLSRDGF